MMNSASLWVIKSGIMNYLVQPDIYLSSLRSSLGCICFRKGSNGKYINHLWFKRSTEDLCQKKGCPFLHFLLLPYFHVCYLLLVDFDSQLFGQIPFQLLPNNQLTLPRPQCTPKSCKVWYIIRKFVYHLKLKLQYSIVFIISILLFPWYFLN